MVSRKMGITIFFISVLVLFYVFAFSSSLIAAEIHSIALPTTNGPSKKSKVIVIYGDIETGDYKKFTEEKKGE